MNTFNEGDRVSHANHGEGTVVNPFHGTGFPAVQFDNGDKIMTAEFLLTPLPKPVPFKNGDRVQHSVHGFARVLRYDEARKLVEIVPDGYGGSSCHVHPVSLTLVVPLTVPKFRVGDRVSHPLHRDGTVENYSEHSGLYTVNVGGNRTYYALEHQITIAVPEPTYHICISEITGAAHVPGSLTAKQVANYIEDKIDWRVVQEIKITKEGTV